MDRLYDPNLRVVAEDEDHLSWLDRKPKGLRLLTALRMVWSPGEPRDAAFPLLLGLIDPPKRTASNLRLAGNVIERLVETRWASKELATRCVEILLKEDLDTLPDYREPAAMAYVEWYASGERPREVTGQTDGHGLNGWRDLEPFIVAGLRDYMSRVEFQPGPEGALEPTEYIQSRLLMQVVIDGVQRSGERPGPARQLLEAIFSLNDQKLEALYIRDLRPRWLAGTSPQQPK